VSQYVVQPDLDGVPRPVDLAPLTAQYERHDVSPDARYVKLDFSDVPNGVALDLDVLARVQGEWKRIRVDGSVFEFCRDDPAEDIDRYLLVVTNHDHQPDGQARGNYRLTTEDHCPARWSGTIDFACTDDETESFSEVGRSTQRERHEVERQRWTIVGQGRGPRPDQPPGIPNPDVDYLELAWNASLSVSTSERIQYEDCLGGPSLQTGGGSGTATARERVNLFPSGDDIMPFPEVVPRAVEAPTVTSIELCSGQSGTIMGEVEAFGRLAFLFLDVPALQLLTPEPDGTITVSGSKIVHELVETTPEGERVLRCDASWNVRRRLAGL
jgi:hypothetical protein